MMRLGVDLGGTKIEGVLMAPNGEILRRKRVPTPQHDYAGTVNAVAELASALSGEEAPDAPLGIGIPGSLSPATGLVRNANSVWLIGEPLDADLAEATARRVRVENDANCFALSEASDGAAAGSGNVFGVIIGTGVGGGLVINGQVVGGANAIGGEWGHNPMPGLSEGEGPICYCGRRACNETYLSGPGMSADFARVVGMSEGDAPAAIEIVELAEAGDPEASAAIHRHGQRLGRALALVVNIVDPEAIVLGGGLSNIEGICERAADAMAAHVFSDIVTTRIVKNMHGDSSGVRGAAWLWSLEEAGQA